MVKARKNIRPQTLWWFVGLFTVLLMGGYWLFRQPEPTTTQDISHLPKLAVGDWVLRMGTVADSRLIRHLSDKGQYSHIGMIVQTQPSIQIIHADTGENNGTSDEVQKVDLSDFISPKMAQYYLIIRPNFINQHQKKMIADALSAQQGKAFLLNPRHKPHRYCTSILQQAINQQTSFHPSWQHINTPVFSGEYLFPDAFLDYENTTIIYQSKKSNQ